MRYTRLLLPTAHAQRASAAATARKVLYGLLIWTVGLALFLGTSARGQDSAFFSSVERPADGERSGTPLILLTARGQDLPALQRTISVQLRGATLEEALKRIAAQAGLDLVYGAEKVAIEKRVSVDMWQVPAREALRAVLQGTGLRLVLLSSGQLILTDYLARLQGARLEPAGAPAALTKVSAATMEPLRLRVQTGMITGTVTDSTTGETLPGVNVVIEGTARGAATSAEGRYTIEGVEVGTYTLVASFVGYADEVVEGVEVVDGETTTVNIALTGTQLGLEEVVVIGYGTQERRDLTGSVSSISAEDIENLPVTSVAAALNGMAAGVNVKQVNAAPGGGFTVRIRGTGSISAGTGPLFVIDGFPVSSGYALDPDNIASIEVLKDASATAIYGSRGANGVVLITTKRGRAGETRINFEARYGFREVTHKLDILSAEEYARFIIESRNNAWLEDGGDPSVPPTERPGLYQVPEVLANPSELGEGTDWQDEIFRTAAVQEYNLSASGGSEATQFYISGSYIREEGIVLGSDFERFSLRANLDAELSSNLRLKLSLSPSLSQASVIPSEGGGVISQALMASPSLPVYNEDGSYSWAGIGFGQVFTSMVNPVGMAKETKDERTELIFLGAASAEYDITDHLIFKTMLGTDINSNRRDYYRPSIVGLGCCRPPTNPVGVSSTSQSINWLSENTLTYDRTFGESHDLNVLMGFTAQEDNADTNFLEATNFPNDLVPTLNAGEIINGSSFRTNWSLLSLLGRVNYSHKGKYLLTATVRRDGSSRFGENKRWGTFPSAALAWRLSEEPFMEPVDVVSELKVRASYGLTGNFSIPNFASIGLLTGVDAILGPGLGTLANGLAPGTLANPDLTWETSRQFDVGLNLGLFDNRVFFTADYYNNVTSGLLLNVQIPAISGFTNTIRNIGKVRNWGMELALSSNILVDDFQWDANFNISFNRNEVLALGPAGDPIFGNAFGTHIYITKIGAPIGSYYGLDVLGIYETKEEVENNPSYVDSDVSYSRRGDFRYRDVNGDGKITIAGDQTIIGGAYPDFTFGITNHFSFKNFGLVLQIDGAYGSQVFNALYRRLATLSGNVNQYESVWKGRYISPEQPGNGWPQSNRLPTGLSLNFSSQSIQNASFMRLRSVVLSYKVSQEVFGGDLFQNLEVYLAAKNAFTITAYKGYNPEVSNAGGNPIRPGFTFGTYPLARSLSIGINLTF